MLAPKCLTFNGRPTFANPMYIKKAQYEKPCLYEIPHDESDPTNRLIPDREEIPTLENYSFAFVHELKQEMHADLKYVESLENEIDELESNKVEFSNMYDMLLQECVSNDVMCSYLHSLSDLDAHVKLQCLYDHKVKECESTLHSWPQDRKSSFAKPYDVNAPGPSRNSLKHVSFQSPRESVGSNDMVHNYYLEEAKKKPQL
ncbi:hypothetical protein Tco_0162617 [Tanacetum coccineum]